MRYGGIIELSGHRGGSGGQTSEDVAQGSSRLGLNNRPAE